MFCFSTRHVEKVRLIIESPLYCRQELVKGVTKIKSSSLDMIWLKLDHGYFGLPQDLYICVAYLFPDSSPYARDTDIFKEFSNEIDFYSRLGNIAIIGDLNVRVGRKQELHIDINVDDETPVYNIATKCRVPLRKGEDQVINTRGRKLMQLMTDHDLLIANGRVCGDLGGNFTCCQWNGLSVVDMMIVPSQFLSRLNFLKIGDFDWYSDHALLSADISVDIAKYRELPGNWQEIHRQFQNWDVETKNNFKSLLSNSRYAERLENYCKTNFTSSVEAADALSSILQSALRAIFPNKKRRAKPSQYSKKINFSAEVQIAKRLFKKCQRDYMKDKDNIDRRQNFIREKK